MGSAILAKLIRRDAVRAAMSAAVGAEVREAAKGGSFPQIGDHTTRTAGTGLSRICGVGLAPARGSAGPGPARRADTPRTNTHNARKALAYTAGVKYSTPILTRSLRFPPQSRILPRPCPPRDPSPARRSALEALLRDLPAGWPPLPAAADYRWPPAADDRQSHHAKPPHHTDHTGTHPRTPPGPRHLPPQAPTPHHRSRHPTSPPPSATYFPHEDCAFSKTTTPRPQSSTTNRSPHNKSTSPINSPPTRTGPDRPAARQHPTDPTTPQRPSLGGSAPAAHARRRPRIPPTPQPPRYATAPKIGRASCRERV